MMSPVEATFARVHALAVSAMAMATPSSSPPIGGGLTALELQRLGHCGPGLLASLGRLLSHLPPEDPRALADWLAARPWLAAGRILAASVPARPARLATVAGKKMTAQKAARRRSSVR